MEAFVVANLYRSTASTLLLLAMLTQEAKISAIFSLFKCNISHAVDWSERTNCQQVDRMPDAREEIMVKKFALLTRSCTYWLACWPFLFSQNLTIGQEWILHNLKFLYYYFSTKMSNSVKFVKNVRILRLLEQLLFFINNISSAEKVIFFYRFLPRLSILEFEHTSSIKMPGDHSPTILKMRHPTPQYFKNVYEMVLKFFSVIFLSCYFLNFPNILKTS